MFSTPCHMRQTLLVLLGFAPSFVFAGTLAVQVNDMTGEPLVNAVVYAESASGQVLPKSLHMVEIEQKKRQFLPLVSVVQAGTEISFPNNDTVRHHVYSFSPAKVFDLPLYSGKMAAPQLFDKPGTVVLGCNIHDRMIAYVQVVDTPYFGKSDSSGSVKLNDLMPGKYILKAWYYGLPQLAQIVEQPVTIGGGGGNATFTLNVKAVVTAN